jgi:polyisoprenoid-binding protein YceI
MKKIMLAITALSLSLGSFAESWKIDPAHTRIHFSTQYLVLTDVEGDFKKFDGTVSSYKADWSDLTTNLKVEVASISTDNEMRDNHLKSDDFFNAEKFPFITFKSKGIRMIDKNKYILTGELTIRDVTKTVELPLVYGGIVKDPWGNTKAGFKATGKINRKEYNLMYKNSAASGEAIVADDVEFKVDIVLIKQ